MNFLLLIPREPISLVFFRGGGGGGGPDLLTPTSLWNYNLEIKRIGRNDRRSPNIRLFDKDCKLISLKVLMLCSGQNSSITNGNNF